jgi:RimJ/RimL family protein N-acetyltransferase
MIFETERLQVRKLILGDLSSFHEMQSNPKVMRFADGEVKTLIEHQKELLDLISKYSLPENNFCIYAIESKNELNFVGIIALVKDGFDNEIGIRFLEKYWNLGYGFEVCQALIEHCKNLNMQKIVGYVVDENIASVKILKRCNFKAVKQFINEDINLPETKYELYL